MKRETSISLGVLVIFLLLGLVWCFLLRTPSSYIFYAPPHMQKNDHTVAWRDITVTAAALPSDSIIEIIKNTDDEFTLFIRPSNGLNTDGSVARDLAISLQLTMIGDESFPKKCVSPIVKDDLSVDTFYTGYYKGVIDHTVATHSTGPYSNPNPYTPEIEQMFKKVIAGMRIGYCN